MRFYEQFIKGQSLDDLWKDLIHMRPWTEMKRLFVDESEPIEIPQVIELEDPVVTYQ